MVKPTWDGALQQLPPWQRLKLRLQGLWIEIEVRLPKRFWWAHAQRIAGRKP